MNTPVSAETVGEGFAFHRWMNGGGLWRGGFSSDAEWKRYNNYVLEDWPKRGKWLPYWCNWSLASVGSNA